jgi:hypothetical protein
MGIRSERGATIIFVAVAMFGLLAFSAIAFDMGVMMVARGQAQTAADAAALAAAQTMAFETKVLADIQAVGQAAGLENKVWGTDASIELTDITFPNCPPTLTWSVTEQCVQARAYRTVARGNAVPTYLANTFGLASQGVQATATARAVAANATNCLKPWAVADKWLESTGPWAQTSTYDAASGDSYVPPSATDYGNGFSQRTSPNVPDYYGYQMVLKLPNPGQGANEIPINAAGWAMELSLNSTGGPLNSTGAYTSNITGCTTDVVAISPPGGNCDGGVNPAIGCLNGRPGSTGANNGKAIDDFIAANDPGARWVNGSGTNGWKTGSVTNSTQSPSSRIVPVGIFHLPELLASGCTGTLCIPRIVNIVGFFIEGTCQTPGVTQDAYLDCPTGGNAKNAIIGRLVNYPALIATTGGTIAGSWGQVIVLVR